MSTHLDGEAPAGTPDRADGEPGEGPPPGPETGSDWVRAEIQRRMAENRSTRGRHARGGEVTPPRHHGGEPAARAVPADAGRPVERRRRTAPWAAAAAPAPAAEPPENYVPRHSVQPPADPANPATGPMPPVRPSGGPIGGGDGTRSGPGGPIGGPSLLPSGLPVRRRRGSGPGRPLQNEGGSPAAGPWSRPGAIVPHEPARRLGAPPDVLGAPQPLPAWGMPLASPPRGFPLPPAPGTAAEPVPDDVPPHRAPAAFAGDEADTREVAGLPMGAENPTGARDAVAVPPDAVADPAGTAVDAAPADAAAPAGRVAQDEAAEDAAAEDAAAEDAAAEDAAAEDAVPEGVVPEGVVPGDVAAEDVAAEDVAAGNAAPEHVGLEDAAPEHLRHEDAGSEEAAAEDAALADSASHDDVALADTAPNDDVAVEDAALEDAAFEDAAFEDAAAGDPEADDAAPDASGAAPQVGGDTGPGSGRHPGHGSAAPVRGTAVNGVPANGAAGNGATGNGASANGTAANGTPTNGSSTNGTPNGTTPAFARVAAPLDGLAPPLPGSIDLPEASAAPRPLVPVAAAPDPDAADVPVETPQESTDEIAGGLADPPTAPHPIVLSRRAALSGRAVVVPAQRTAERARALAPHPAATRNTPVVDTTPQEQGSTRVRVVLSERKGVARPVRTIKEVQEGTAVGDLLRRDLIRSQLLVTLRFALLTVVVLGVLPAVFALLPQVSRFHVLGVRLPWVVLGLLMYPFLVGVAWRYTRVADRVEQNFADHVQD